MMIAPERGLLRSILDFGTIGILATATHVLVGLGLVHLGLLAPFGANVIAFLVAFAVSYIGHRSYSFRSTAAHRSALPRFLLVALGGLLMNQVTVVVVVHRMMLPYAAALVIIVTVIPAVTFVFARYWAFRRPVEVEQVSIGK